MSRPPRGRKLSIFKPRPPKPESVESVVSRVRSEVEAIPKRLGLRLAYHGGPLVALGGTFWA